jgi:hypothetical protein
MSNGSWVNTRYREGALEPGDQVSVLGRVRFERDSSDPTHPRASYRGGARRNVIEAATKSRPVLVNDDPSTLGRAPGGSADLFTTLAQIAEQFSTRLQSY